MSKRILVAGIGNIFCGDDAFGVEVVRELLKSQAPEGVTIKDFGIRSYDLALALLEGYDYTILIDATSRGQTPGTLYLIQPEPGAMDNEAVVDGHSLNPAQVFQMVHAFGGTPGNVHLIGCEPGVLESEQIGLSPSVQASIPEAVEMVGGLIREYLAKPASGKSPVLYAGS